jgi:hypothetical protein
LADGAVGEVATSLQVYQEIRGLTKDDYLKFFGMACAVVWGRPEQDPGDLVQEALLRTMDGRRAWMKKIPFVVHVLGVIRSLTSHDAEKAAASTVSLDSGSGGDSKEGKLSETIAAPQDDPDEDLELAREKLLRLKSYFKDDEEVLLIIEDWLVGMKRAEILEDLGLSPTDYDAAVKRIRRYVLSLPQQGMNNV